MDVTRHLSVEPGPRVLFDRLAEWSDRTRFVVPQADGTTTRVSYREHAEEVRRVGLWLASLDLGRDFRGVVFAPNRVEWLAAAGGIQLAGGAVVPVYPASTAAQAGHVVAHSGADVVFVDTLPLVRRLAEAGDALASVRHIVVLDPALMPEAAAALGADRVLSWGQALAAGADGDVAPLLDRLDLDQLALMLYTSGTTGTPKGVPLTHRNIATNGRDWLQVNAPLLADDDVDVLWLPFSHVFGFGEAGLGTQLGWTSHLTTPADALQALQDVRPTVFMSVPAYWEKLAGAAAGDADTLRRLTGGRLRFCLSGGAGLKRDVKQAFLAAGMLIIEGYGLTEAAPTLTLNRHDAFRFDSVGKPLPSVALRLADDGEIQARGPNIFSGYHDDPAATAATFTADGWLKTGDLGRFTEDGFLQIIGRKKEILVTAGGKNIPPANIEMCFADDPLIAHLVVHGDGRRYLVAGVWLDADAADTWLRAHESGDDDGRAALDAEVGRRIAAVNATLARHETLKRWRVFFDDALTVEMGHLTSTLKLRRKQIAQTYGPQLDALYA